MAGRQVEAPGFTLGQISSLPYSWIRVKPRGFRLHRAHHHQDTDPKEAVLLPQGKAHSGQDPPLPPVSRSQTFTVPSHEAVATLGVNAGPWGRKTHEVVVWKCPLYSHTWFRVCRRSHSCKTRGSVQSSGSATVTCQHRAVLQWKEDGLVKELLAFVPRSCSQSWTTADSEGFSLSVTI